MKRFILSIFIFLSGLTYSHAINYKVEQIWSNGQHCTFREGYSHIFDNEGNAEGKIRILASKNGKKWESVALIGKDGYDLRDPKFSITPDGRLMVSLGGSIYRNRKLVGAQSHVMFSEDGKEYIADFLPGFMEDSYVDGKIYSIPFQRSTEIMYYNKDKFVEAGLDPESPPENWDELLEYAKKLTTDDCYGVGIALNSGSAQWTFTGYSLQNSTDGKQLMSEDGKQVYFNTPENVEALQFWLDLQNKHKVMAEGIVQWTDLPTQFLAGEVAMIYHTTGNMTNINSNAEFEFGTCFLPGNKQMGAPTGGGNFYISSGLSEERVQAAWKFIRFMTETERAAQWSLDTGYVATRQSCFETDLIQNYYEEVPQAKVAYEQIAVAKPELTTYNASEIWRVLNDNIQSAVVGDATAQEAMENAQAEAEEVLAEFQ